MFHVKQYSESRVEQQANYRVVVFKQKQCQYAIHYFNPKAKCTFSNVSRETLFSKYQTRNSNRRFFIPKTANPFIDNNIYNCPSTFHVKHVNRSSFFHSANHNHIEKPLSQLFKYKPWL